mgnify:FL=1
MTSRERNLWLVVAVVMVAVLAYRLFFGNSGSLVAEKTAGPRLALAEAESLLKAAGDIMARGKAVAARLSDLEGRFFPAEQPDESRAELLRVVEGLAYRSMLSV